MAVLHWRRPRREQGQGPGNPAPTVLRKYGRRLLPPVKHFVVFRVSWNGGITAGPKSESAGVCLYARDCTWQAFSEISSHPTRRATAISQVEDSEFAARLRLF